MMKAAIWAWLLGCSAAVVLANVVLRIAIDRAGVKLFADGLAGVPAEVWTLLKSPLFLLAIILYGVAMLIWFRLVAIAPLSVAYPALACLTFVAISLAGIFLFAEPVHLLRLCGLLVMLVGLTLMSLS